MNVKPKILVVDDEPEVVSYIAEILTPEGFEVVSACDGVAALDMVDSENPDLVVLDIMMPMMSGYEVCQQIKASPETRDLPVICISSAHAPNAREQSLKAGASTLVVKPFLPDELVAQIRRYLK